MTQSLIVAPGTRLGAYEVVARIGAGGMGEVWRARDEKLGREVAIKVLPERFSQDEELRGRFEREARAVAALSHPNILAIFDYGSQEGHVYAVTELLEGATLRATLENGALPLRRAIDYAVQIAEGLGAAHERGVVHRDLKPENVFVTTEGRVKILDFGLAKRSSLTSKGWADGATHELTTEPGTILGTVGYMSPEQVRGQDVDHRSDVFSFGVLLYEMLSGRRAFHADSAAEVLAAILREEPELTTTGVSLLPPLRAILDRCLEKDPGRRFQSCRDLAFALGLTHSLGGAPATSSAPAAPSTQPVYRRLTFRRGFVDRARFGPDGVTIVYAALWDGGGIELYSGRTDSIEARALGLPGATVHAVSSGGNLAVSLGYKLGYQSGVGTLARMPIAGGAPRELFEEAEEADWSPDGKDLAVVTSVAGRARLEYPVGEVLYESQGEITNPRVSPQGDAVAFIDHPLRHDTGGAVMIVGLDRRVRVLSAGWGDAGGLAWSPSGEVWFTATRAGTVQALHAVTVAGEERVVLRAAGRLYLHDIFRDGRLLVTHSSLRSGIAAQGPGEAHERELSWMDWSSAPVLSEDGRLLVFDESGEGGGEGYSLYMRRVDGSPAVRLGDGFPLALSPDRRFVLAAVGSPSRPWLLPTGAGKGRELLAPGLVLGTRGAWFPDGSRVLYEARDRSGRARSFAQELLPASEPVPVTPEGVTAVAITPDGRMLAAAGADGRHALYAVDGSEVSAIPGLEDGEVPIRWSGDGGALFVVRQGELPARVVRIDLASGARTAWRELMRSDAAGLLGIGPVCLTADGAAYAYRYRQVLSDLLLVEGVS